MSLNGLDVFRRNLQTLTESDAFQAASDIERMELSYRLLNSKYGIGSWFGFGGVKVLKPPKERE